VDSLCETMAKKSWLPGAEERCKGNAKYGGNWGKKVRELIQTTLQIQSTYNQTNAVANRINK